MAGGHWQSGPIGFPPVQHPAGGHGKSYVPIDPSAPWGYPPYPQFDDCLLALRALLEETLFNSIAAPHHEPPFNAKSIERTTRAVINVPAAFDAAANAAGVALAAAAATIVAVPVLTPATAAPPFGPVNVLQITTAPGHVNVYRTVGVTVLVGAPEAASVRIEAMGPNANPDGPSPLSSSATSGERQELLALVPENRTLTVAIENLDSSSPILVALAVGGWSMPVTGYTDDVRGLYPWRGYGRNACSWVQRGKDKR